MEHIRTSINDLLTKKNRVVIAIDGKAAAGKTTLAKTLSAHYDSTWIPMDDFFLPKSLRTEARFKEPGGNIHYEYFKTQVIDHLSNNQIKYQPFDCHVMAFKPSIKKPLKQLIVIEGSYALHPYFGKYYDLSIFVDIHPDVQFERIIKRNTQDQAQMFINRWIVYETRYQNHYDIENQVDIKYQTT